MSSDVAKGGLYSRDNCPCRTGQRQKLLLDQWFMLFNLTKIKIVFLREAICGLQYAENASAAGALPRAPLGELTTLPRPPSQMGSGHPFPASTPLGAGSLPPKHNFWLCHCYKTVSTSVQTVRVWLEDCSRAWKLR